MSKNIAGIINSEVKWKGKLVQKPLLSKLQKHCERALGAAGQGRRNVRG